MEANTHTTDIKPLVCSKFEEVQELMTLIVDFRGEISEYIHGLDPLSASSEKEDCPIVETFVDKALRHVKTLDETITEMNSEIATANEEYEANIEEMNEELSESDKLSEIFSEGDFFRVDEELTLHLRDKLEILGRMCRNLSLTQLQSLDEHFRKKGRYKGVDALGL